MGVCSIVLFFYVGAFILSDTLATSIAITLIQIGLNYVDKKIGNSNSYWNTSRIFFYKVEGYHRSPWKTYAVKTSQVIATSVISQYITSICNQNLIRKIQ